MLNQHLTGFSRNHILDCLNTRVVCARNAYHQTSFTACRSLPVFDGCEPIKTRMMSTRRHRCASTQAHIKQTIMISAPLQNYAHVGSLSGAFTVVGWMLRRIHATTTLQRVRVCSLISIALILVTQKQPQSILYVLAPHSALQSIWNREQAHRSYIAIVEWTDVSESCSSFCTMLIGISTCSTLPSLVALRRTRQRRTLADNTQHIHFHFPMATL